MEKVSILGNLFEFESGIQADSVKPDFEVGDNPNSAPIRYIHRQIELDVYFVTNQRRTPEDIICNFRVEGKVPEFWNPLTGEGHVLVYQKNEGMTSVLSSWMNTVLFLLYFVQIFLNRQLFVLFIKIVSVWWMLQLFLLKSRNRLNILV